MKYKKEFNRLLDVAEQALSGVNFDTRKVTGFTPLFILKQAVEYYRQKLEKRKIRFLYAPLTNWPSGDTVEIENETETEIYYFDGFHRYCYVLKSDEGSVFQYVDSNG